MGISLEEHDYDVRFIYVHQRDWYLSFQLENKPDTIERPIVDEIDCSGWDVRKTQKLFVKSNPPLLEWLASDILYLDRYEFAEALRGFRSEFSSPPACACHYLHMAQGNYRAYLQGEKVWLRKYFYVLPPILAVKWIEEKRGMVPMQFQSLLATVADHKDLLDTIESLLTLKQAGDELEEGLPIPAIKAFIDGEMRRLENWKPEEYRGKVDYSKLDELFRRTLDKAW